MNDRFNCPPSAYRSITHDFCSLCRVKRGPTPLRHPPFHVERRSDATTKTNLGSKPIKTTSDLFGNILCLELNQLSTQYLKSIIHQSLALVFGHLPDPHRPSASDSDSHSSSHPNKIRQSLLPGLGRTPQESFHKGKQDSKQKARRYS